MKCKMREQLRLYRQKIQRQRHESLPPPPADYTAHTCPNCGAHYQGRYCPQCSMPASWKRMTPKSLVMGFLDIWGMGNRPIFRSIEQLFLRPGYMIRDYLAGHHLRYFPPFKMLAVLTVLLALAVWLRGAEESKSLWSPGAIDDTILGYRLSAVLGYFHDHTLYRLLLQNVFVVLAAWIVFRRCGLNLVETTFSQIYINCQMQVVAILWVLLTGTIGTSSSLPYAVPNIIALLLLFYDFHQLYRLKPWATIWRMLLMFLLIILMFVVALIGLFTILVIYTAILETQ